MNSPLAKEIAHLSSAQIEELYARYLAGEKNIELIREFNIHVHQNRLLSLFPPVVHEDASCPYCAVFMQSERRGKNDSKWRIPAIRCPVCSHSIYPSSGLRGAQACSCNNCHILAREEWERAEAEQRSIINAKHNIDKLEPVEYELLGFRDKFLLFTLLRYQANESLDFICSFSEAYSKKAPFAATDDFRSETARNLYGRSLIAVSKHSPVSAFKEGADFEIFFLDYVRWIPNVSIDGVRLSIDCLHERILSDFQMPIPLCLIDEVGSVLYELAGDEVAQYLQMRCDELGVDFAPEKKTCEVVAQLLNDFSVSEIYYFATKAVENAHLFYKKGYAKNKKHAANTIPGKMQSLGERALAEGWNLKKYSRDSRVPQSALNKVIYGTIFRDEDSGFCKSPAENIVALKAALFVDPPPKNASDLFCSACESLGVEIRRVDDSIALVCLDCGAHERFVLDKPNR